MSSRLRALWDQIGITNPISAKSHLGDLPLTRGDSKKSVCRRGESNPYVLSDRRV
jgi:hypothetical protein